MDFRAAPAPDHARALLPDERFAAAVRARRGPLLRYVLSLLPGDPQRAEDVVQETLLRAWQAARGDSGRDAGRPPPAAAGAGSARTDPQEPAAAWLFTVARNVVIDWSRRDGVRPALLASPAPDLAAPVDDPARVADRAEVVALLTPLSRRHREVLVYTYLLGSPGPDTARALAIPPGTVKSRLHHALREARHTAARHDRDCA
ncbi:sigma-70 family RNA polymerase sigma factor [Streptomyces sp. NPDC018000]|uniref:sigma-70 family RNA polymerase sigma factor n=1 Tax=Streptomyces sp. NPDC018000 TaxID=3365028 RepID=UPI00379868ED